MIFPSLSGILVPMEQKGKKWIWILFGLYCAVMAWLLFGQRLGSPLTEEALAGASRLNLEPFSMIRHFVQIVAMSDNRRLVASALVNLAGNVAVFVPLGIFLPWLWRAMGKLWLFLPVLVLVITAVEGIQYATLLGVCDVDDLILNTAGGLIGWVLFMVVHNAKQRKASL